MVHHQVFQIDHRSAAARRTIVSDGAAHRLYGIGRYRNNYFFGFTFTAVYGAGYEHAFRAIAGRGCRIIAQSGSQYIGRAEGGVCIIKGIGRQLGRDDHLHIADGILFKGSVVSTDTVQAVSTFYTYLNFHTAAGDAGFAEGLVAVANLAGVFGFQGFYPIDDAIYSDVVIRLHVTAGATQVDRNSGLISRGDREGSRFQAEFAIDVIEADLAANPPDMITSAHQGRKVSAQGQPFGSDDRQVAIVAGAGGSAAALTASYKIDRPVKGGVEELLLWNIKKRHVNRYIVAFTYRDIIQGRSRDGCHLVHDHVITDGRTTELVVEGIYPIGQGGKVYIGRIGQADTTTAHIRPGAARHV